MVGRAISGSRQNWVLATKLGNPVDRDPNRAGLSRRWVLQAADESLKRLGTDTIDIYYLHKEEHSTPLDETVRAMGDLIRQGKVRYFGVSNYRPGGSPKSATSATSSASTGRSSASLITMR